MLSCSTFYCKALRSLSHCKLLSWGPFSMTGRLTCQYEHEETTLSCHPVSSESLWQVQGVWSCVCLSPTFAAGSFNPVGSESGPWWIGVWFDSWAVFPVCRGTMSSCSARILTFSGALLVLSSCFDGWPVSTMHVQNQGSSGLYCKENVDIIHGELHCAWSLFILYSYWHY